LTPKRFQKVKKQILGVRVKDQFWQFRFFLVFLGACAEMGGGGGLARMSERDHSNSKDPLGGASQNIQGLSQLMTDQTTQANSEAQNLLANVQASLNASGLQLTSAGNNIAQSQESNRSLVATGKPGDDLLSKLEESKEKLQSHPGIQNIQNGVEDIQSNCGDLKNITLETLKCIDQSAYKVLQGAIQIEEATANTYNETFNNVCVGSNYLTAMKDQRFFDLNQADKRFEKIIQQSAEEGILTGSTNDKQETRFLPKDSVTRAQATATTQKLLSLLCRPQTFSSVEIPHDQLEDQPFTDVGKDKWFWEPVARAKKLSMASGHQDGSFKPQETVTIGQMNSFLRQLSLSMEEICKRPEGSQAQSDVFKPLSSEEQKIDLANGAFQVTMERNQKFCPIEYEDFKDPRKSLSREALAVYAVQWRQCLAREFCQTK
jgi:hypothetical protein